ncbi:MAG: aspartate-semialdehyde dehydrogenase, partial [Candidatus Gastranaerophilales bacterium]|nr:aspartate-semialdehyde dehydrogenase [Candidatus Gastranaerophilales bacterium]
MTNLPNIAVLGATGVVGREILSILEENNVQYNSIKFLASARSAGSTIEFKGEKHTVIEATPEAFEGVNICLASAGGETSKIFAPIAASKGCVYIDNSSAFRMDKDVPLVIAGVNDEDLRLHKGIIANPNCSTSQLMLPLKALDNKYKVKKMIVSTYQAVSGAGLKAINELTDNIKTNLVGMPYE